MVVAAASLAITSWGTYKAAQVANDQLTQSREDNKKEEEDNKKEERAQASRISMWVEGTEPTRIVLANRSLDPAWAFLHNYSLGPKNIPRNTMGIGVLPPCTRLSMPITKFIPDVQEDLLPQKGTSHGKVKLAIIDADGRKWLRGPDGSLESVKDFGEYHGNMSMADGGSATWVMEKSVEVKTLPECGRAS
ncbi:hypothetical protein [Streptomyces boluensis]|uniref:Uncharacterized protein n=1 Tax=Streptomyces boluensis TaxID=1775135 RepID=A0A964XM28_9ACTN|nr:hypothetical protein [Streptomyces boluensis]NBE53965.1 hypothetical protein [Streptomyces boluensis]